jgi:hypothetical protein
LHVLNTQTTNRVGNALPPLTVSAAERGRCALIPAMASDPARRIGIVLFDGVEELDAVGPWEVLGYWTRQHPEDGFAVSCISLTERP